MERIKNLDRYQKGILVVLLAMAIVFAGVYANITSRIGYLYNDQILEAGAENGNTVYRAEVSGEEITHVEKGLKDKFKEVFN